MISFKMHRFNLNLFGLIKYPPSKLLAVVLLLYCPNYKCYAVIKAEELHAAL